MLKPLRYWRYISTVTVLVCLTVLFTSYAAAFDFYGWRHGAYGHRDVLEASRLNETPVIVYFNTDWCPWCRKLNEKYLNSYEVKGFLRDIEKVEINPEKGPTEKAIGEEYGLTGYPTFLVYVPAINSNPQRLYPFKKTQDWSPSEFVQKIKQRIAHIYSNEGVIHTKSGQYNKALSYYKMALIYDPENIYANYLTAFTYHYLGNQQRDLELISMAREYYQKTLELNPNHIDSKKGLETLGSRDF